MSLSFTALTVLEGPRLRTTTQTDECRLVEDILQSLIAAASPFMVTGLFAGVAGGWCKTGVGGELVGTLEAREVSDSDQKLGPEHRPHPWQASEDLSLLPLGIAQELYPDDT